MAEERILCNTCQKTLPETDFYKMKSGERCDICKHCLTRHIDNKKPETFEWILEKFDVPYIKEVWIDQSNKQYVKNPGKFGSSSVIGIYLRMMNNMSQYTKYSYADSDRLNYEYDKSNADLKARREALKNNEEAKALLTKLEEQLANGEITQGQFDTLNPFNILEEEEEKIGVDFIKPIQIDETDIQKSLTAEDIQYLALKWGINYKPSEWVQMEDMYNKYTSEYEMNIDREETLKQICKTALKMNQCLDMGDIPDAQKLQNMLDSLRKSAKFTEVQNKDGTTKQLDTIGELVALCEREGGIIDQFPDPDEYPRDKVDITIKDLKNYTYNLVSKELGLGTLIEQFIEKYERAEAEKAKEDEEMENGQLDSEKAELIENNFDNNLQDEIDELFAGDDE